MSSNDKVKIIFFDGHCVLCNRFVNIILKYNKSRTLKIASLQGIAAQKYLSTNDLTPPQSVILLTEKTKYYASDAVIEIAKELVWPYSILVWMSIFPKSLRDFGYRLIAKYRYKIWGSLQTCRVATSHEKSFFLD